MATCLNYNDDRPPSPTSSTTSSSSTKYDWELLESNINSTEIATYIKCNIPRTQSYQNNYNVKCYFCLDELECVNHKIKRQYRLCKEGDRCEVKYRVDYCKIKDIGRDGQHVFMSQEFISNFKNSNNILLINGLMVHSITGKYLIRLLVIRLLKILKSHSTVK